MNKSKNYILTDTILHQTGEFKANQIILELQSKHSNLFKDIYNTKKLVERKLKSLCEVGLISGTGIVYWVSK